MAGIWNSQQEVHVYVATDMKHITSLSADICAPLLLGPYTANMLPLVRYICSHQLSGAGPILGSILPRG